MGSDGGAAGTGLKYDKEGAGFRARACWKLFRGAGIEGRGFETDGCC